MNYSIDEAFVDQIHMEYHFHNFSFHFDRKMIL